MSITGIAVDLFVRHLSLSASFLFLSLAGWRVYTLFHRSENAKRILEKAIETQTHEPVTLHPEIDPALCSACGACTQACPEGDILRLVHHKAVLVEPTHCVGHGECERACPTGAITLVFGTKSRGMDIPRISTDYETNVPGLYIAGELGGMGLIRNAIKQGHLAAQHALSSLSGSSQKDRDTDLLIVGAGPAGLGAALTAIAERKNYICIDQNTFGGTVNNFPRQKIVMSHPAYLPIIGKMKFKRNRIPKEELLEFWNDVRKKTGLEVRERTQFESLQKIEENFHVKTNCGVIRAAKVVLCMGVRGNPRRLGLTNEDLPKVAYNLIDPEQYKNNRIVVVGGGNAGVEAAQALANVELKNEVTLLVRGTSLDRCNKENKEIIEKLASEGALQIWFDSAVKEIHSDSLCIKKGEELKTVPNDYLFVFAGANLPHQFLMSLGVHMDKKFGEALSKSA